MKCCEELCGVEGIDPGSRPSPSAQIIGPLWMGVMHVETDFSISREMSSNAGKDSLHKLILCPL